MNEIFRKNKNINKLAHLTEIVDLIVPGHRNVETLFVLPIYLYLTLVYCVPIINYFIHTDFNITQVNEYILI